MTTVIPQVNAALQVASVIANQRLCREHYRLTICVRGFDGAAPGHFVHVCPTPIDSSYREFAWSADPSGLHQGWLDELRAPMLRRAFSIAGRRNTAKGQEIEVIYRVVGTATQWMESLRHGNDISVLGPLGNTFPISKEKPNAWLVAGGVGLPPMLWLAETLVKPEKSVVAFCGVRSRELFPLTLDESAPPSHDAESAERSAIEFARHGALAVISTDDGSLGFHGHIGAALSAYHRSNPVECDRLVVYACGPERMMHFVADYCVTRGIECYLCMERNMACGTGLCQSCVVPIRDGSALDGWRYRLCCTDGPVFPAEVILWETPTGGK